MKKIIALAVVAIVAAGFLGFTSSGHHLRSTRSVSLRLIRVVVAATHQAAEQPRCTGRTVATGGFAGIDHILRSTPVVAVTRGRRR